MFLFFSKMKINNKTSVIRFFITAAIVFGGLFLALFSAAFLWPSISIFKFAAATAALFLLFLWLLQAKFLEFEFHGEWISFKKKRVFANKKNVRAVSEFPVYQLTDYRITKNLFWSVITLDLKNTKNKRSKISIPALAFDANMRRRVRRILEGVKKENENKRQASEANENTFTV